MSAAGWWGLALLALLVATYFVPPIPPIHKAWSVPGYALSLAVTALLAIEAGRSGAPLRAWWRRQGGVARAVLAAAVPAFLAMAFAMRAASPGLFRRFSQDEVGLWETLTLTAYLAAAVLLLGARAGRPWRLLAALYLWLALEEVDYFGIFGGLIGRIGGEYAGSLHDAVRLTALGIMGPRAWAVGAFLAVVLAALLWRYGYLQPRWSLARLAEPRVLWALAGLALLWAAGAEEARLFGWAFAPPSPEEAIELAGAALLFVYALEAAARPGAPGAVR